MFINYVDRGLLPTAAASMQTDLHLSEAQLGVLMSAFFWSYALVQVPIGWVAVGNPAQIYPPGQHEEIWAVQEGLDFPGTVYGVSRDTPAAERMARQANWFSAHRDDRPLDG